MKKRELYAYTLVAVAGFVWMYGKYAQWKSFLTNTFDYGIFENIAYSIINHGTFFDWPEFFLHGASSHFQVHFQPIIVVYALALKFTGKPWILGVVDATNWLIAGLLVVYFAKKEGKDPLFWGFLWVFNPITQVVYFDAHPISFALPFGVVATYGALKRNWKLFAVGAAGLFFVKEDAGLLLLGIAAYMLNDRIGEAIDSPIDAVKRALKENRDAVMVGLTGLIFILASSAMIFLKGRHWVMNLYFTPYSVLLSPAGLFYITLDFLLLGFVFIKKNRVGYFAAVMVIMLENLVTIRGTQIVYWFHYYTYLAAFFPVALMFSEVTNVKKYAATIFLIGIIVSPMMPLGSKTPLYKDLGYQKDQAGILEMGYKYAEYSSAYDELYTSFSHSISERLQEDGYVCVGPKLYPVMMHIDPDRVYPAMYFFDGERQVFGICKTVVMVVKYPNCVGNCLPVVSTISTLFTYSK